MLSEWKPVSSAVGKRKGKKNSRNLKGEGGKRKRMDTKKEVCRSGKGGEMLEVTAMDMRK